MKLKLKIAPDVPKNGFGLIQMIVTDESIRQKWVKTTCFLNLASDSVFLSLLGVILYAGLTYLPGHIVMMFHFLLGMHEET